MSSAANSSSATGAAIFRAMSPVTRSLAEIALDQGDGETIGLRRRRARLMALQSATSVEDLVAIVPDDYRLLLAPTYRDVATKTQRLCHAQATLHRWSLLQEKGELPPHLKVAHAEVQMTKAYAESPDGREQLAAFKTTQANNAKALFAEAIRAKTDEVAFLERALLPQAMLDAMVEPIKSQTLKLLKQRQLPIFGRNQPDGPLEFQKYEEDPAVVALGHEMVEDCVIFAYRVRSVIEGRELVAAEKVKRKKELAAHSDDMDVDQEPRSIAKMVQEAVDAKLGKGKNKASFSLDDNLAYAYDLLIEQEAAQREEDLIFPTPRRQGKRPVRSAAVPQAPQAQDRRQQQEQGQRRQRQRQEVRQGEEDQLVAFDWRYGEPHTLPDFLLDLPLIRAVTLIRLNTPVDVLLAASFRSGVHVSPGVSLPAQIAMDLSVGMKYMYFSPRNKELIVQSWREFQTRLRWRLKFAFEDMDAPYDPDYDVRVKSDARPPILPQYLELGFLAGRRFVNNTIANIPEEEPQATTQALAPSARQIREFLVRNDYVVTATDKNLGIAVSKRTWIVEKCLEILADAANYRPLSILEATRIQDEKCTKMREAAEVAGIYAYEEGAVEDFLLSKVTKDGDRHNVPRFYGIPKIHKQPVKMRPIIPCHSAIQNPAAKYISKKLKPLIQAAPTVIHGTKDLATKLSKLNLTPGRSWFIVTGDVVAFYPNIPIQPCLEIVAGQYRRWYEDNVNYNLTRADERRLDLFNLCLDVGNTKLVTQFQDTFYLQLKGLAMGVADSPDLANLYGWHFEEQNRILDHPDVAFYGRYIDDCFGLVYASSEQEALKVLEDNVRFDGCVIEWNASRYGAPFLDMFIYQDEFGRIQHMPYRKNGNHQERIPWISHHPLDVKRGTFTGEMSRLATLCSLRSHYSDACAGLVALYVKRGYPRALVSSWLRNNIEERWAKRLNDTPPARNDVLVLKTEFNSAWNYFNAKELGDTILGYWREAILAIERNDFGGKLGLMAPEEGYAMDLRDAAYAKSHWFVRGDGQSDVKVPDIRRLDILQRRLITSRKRTRNMFDLTSLWKKIVFNRLDEREGEDVDPPENRIRDIALVAAPVHPQAAPGEGDDSSEEDVLQVHRHSSPVPRTWRYAAW